MVTRKTAAKTGASTGGAGKSTPKSKGKASTSAEARPATAAASTPRRRVADDSGIARTRPSVPATATAAAAVSEVPSGETRYRWIAHAAYLRAEKRGFTPGQEVEDWLAAEAEFLVAHGLARD